MGFSRRVRNFFFLFIINFQGKENKQTISCFTKQGNEPVGQNRTANCRLTSSIDQKGPPLKVFFFFWKFASTEIFQNFWRNGKHPKSTKEVLFATFVTYTWTSEMSSKYSGSLLLTGLFLSAHCLILHSLSPLEESCFTFS